MKIPVLLILSVLASTAAHAQNIFDRDEMMIKGGGVEIVVCNRSEHPTAYVATGMSVAHDKVWVRGWWRVDRGACASIGRHSVGATWYYGEIPDRSRVWQGPVASQDMLCVEDGTSFNTIVDVFGVGIGGCNRDRSGYRAVEFGKLFTGNSDIDGRYTLTLY